MRIYIKAQYKIQGVVPWCFQMLNVKRQTATVRELLFIENRPKNFEVQIKYGSLLG